MIHVWLIKPQSKLRVWDTRSEQWHCFDGWQAVAEASIVKANDQDVCLYVSTQSVLSITNDLTVSQVKQLGATGQQYLFEDTALSSVEQLRVRHLYQGGQQFFYALSTNEVDQWQQRLQLAGFKIIAMLPDFVLLPIPESRLGSEVTLFQDKIEASSALIFRQSEAQGLSISHLSLLPSLLPKLLPNVDEIIYLSSESILDKGTLSTKQNHDIPGVLKQVCDDNSIVITLSNQSIRPVLNPIKHSLNFVEIKRKRLASPYLSLAASLLLLACGTQIIADLIASYQYDKAIISTRAANGAQFASWFDGESLNPKVNVISQVQPRLIKGGQEKQTQLSTLNRISPIIKQSNLIAQSIEWNDSNIAITVKGTNRDDIDKIQLTLSDQGIPINLETVNPTSDGGVIGKINIPLTSSDTPASNGK